MGSLNGCFHHNLNLFMQAIYNHPPNNVIPMFMRHLRHIEKLEQRFQCFILKPMHWLALLQEVKNASKLLFLITRFFFTNTMSFAMLCLGFKAQIYSFQRCLQSFVRYHWLYLIPPTMFLSTLHCPLCFFNVSHFGAKILSILITSLQI